MPLPTGDDEAVNESGRWVFLGEHGPEVVLPVGTRGTRIIPNPTGDAT